MKKVAVLGGGTGMSVLLKGMKKFPFEITAIVSVCDDGKSTGRLREEFKIPAVGDVRKVLIALSEKENETKKILDYRFDTTSDLNNHALGNLLLTAVNDISGNMSDGIELLNSIINLKGKVLPLTEDNVVLMGQMEDNEIIQGEHNITEDKRKIIDVFYKEKPTVTPEVIKSIKKADAIVLSMGSLFTSIIPNLICEELISEIDKSKAKIIYVCNMMTQPGETDDFKVSDHIKLLNRYLGKRKIDAVLINKSKIPKKLTKIYETCEQKDLVKYDAKAMKELNTDIILDEYATLENNVIRHNAIKVSLNIYSYLLD